MDAGTRTALHDRAASGKRCSDRDGRTGREAVSRRDPGRLYTISVRSHLSALGLNRRQLSTVVVIGPRGHAGALAAVRVQTHTKESWKMSFMIGTQSSTITR